MEIQSCKRSDQRCFKSFDVLAKDSSVLGIFISRMWDLLAILHECRSKLDDIAIQPV